MYKELDPGGVLEVLWRSSLALGFGPEAVSSGVEGWFTVRLAVSLHFPFSAQPWWIRCLSVLLHRLSTQYNPASECPAIHLLSIHSEGYSYSITGRPGAPVIPQSSHPINRLGASFRNSAMHLPLRGLSEELGVRRILGIGPFGVRCIELVPR